jgi:dienelactone hydrolase
LRCNRATTPGVAKIVKRALLLLSLASAAPAQATRTDVRIPTRDATALEATYYSPGKPGPAAVVFRNCDQKRGAVEPFALQLRDSGVHVVVYDYRGGLMQGRDWNATRRADFAAVRDWLVTQPGADSLRLAAIGGSCGVQVALQFAMDYAPNVKAALIMSGPHTDAQREFVARTQELALLAVASAGEGSEQYMKPIAAVARHPASRMIVLPGRSHGTNMLTDPTGLDTTALAWLGARLGRP